MMKYIVMMLILILCTYTYGFIKYSWNNKNKMASIGAAILIFTSIIIPAYAMFR
jgi:uncharacterized membrane protein